MYARRAWSLWVIWGASCFHYMICVGRNVSFYGSFMFTLCLYLVEYEQFVQTDIQKDWWKDLRWCTGIGKQGIHLTVPYVGTVRVTFHPSSAKYFVLPARVISCWKTNGGGDEMAWTRMTFFWTRIPHEPLARRSQFFMNSTFGSHKNHRLHRLHGFF